jgi:dipeptidyl aminopeptidase/acylaminoacyl peptidase
VYCGGGRVFAGHWSPDGSRLTAAEWVEGNSDHIVYLVPLDGSPATRLTPPGPPATYWLGPWLPDGSGFLVRSNAGREFTGLAVLDAGTGELTWLDAPDRDVEAVALAADGRTLVWVTNVDGANQLHGRDLVTGADLPLPRLPLGEVDALSLSADGRLLVMLLATPRSPWNVVTLDLATGRLCPLTDAAPTGADPAGFVEPELVRFPSGTGEEIPAWLYRPPAATGPVGVLLAIHGGPVFQERPGYIRDGFYQYLLSRGVAVLAPNIHGSSGYGKSYTQRIYRDWGGVDLTDFAGAAAWLRGRDWVDPTRIGVFGGSYGGFAVLTCISRLPEVQWAAAVDVFGISNLVTLAQASPPTWRSLVRAVIGDPDEDRDALLARSPISYADQIRAPLFVIQGANDPRVPQAESDQIVQRLRARGVEVRYDVYPDEGHGFTKTENQITALSAAADFLLAHLT